MQICFALAVGARMMVEMDTSQGRKTPQTRPAAAATNPLTDTQPDTETEKTAKRHHVHRGGPWNNAQERRGCCEWRDVMRERTYTQFIFWARVRERERWRKRKGEERKKDRGARQRSACLLRWQHLLLRLSRSYLRLRHKRVLIACRRRCRHPL